MTRILTTQTNELAKLVELRILSKPHDHWKIAPYGASSPFPSLLNGQDLYYPHDRRTTSGTKRTSALLGCILQHPGEVLVSKTTIRTSLQSNSNWITKRETIQDRRTHPSNVQVLTSPDGAIFSRMMFLNSSIVTCMKVHQVCTTSCERTAYRCGVFTFEEFSK